MGLSRVVKVVPKFRSSHAIQWLPGQGCTLDDVVKLFDPKYKVTEIGHTEVFLTGRRGKLMVTITKFNDRLQVYLRKGVFREVYPGFWIVVDDNMEVMVLSDEEFRDTHDFKVNQGSRQPVHGNGIDGLDLDQLTWESSTVRRNKEWAKKRE